MGELLGARPGDASLREKLCTARDTWSNPIFPAASGRPHPAGRFFHLTARIGHHSGQGCPARARHNDRASSPSEGDDQFPGTETRERWAVPTLRTGIPAPQHAAPGLSPVAQQKQQVSDVDCAVVVEISGADLASGARAPVVEQQE